MPTTFNTPDDFRAQLLRLTMPDPEAVKAAREHQRSLTKPPGSLGRLEEIAVWLAGWQPDGIPRANSIRVTVFAGNHGVTARGVSPYPSSVTAQMVANFEAGGAAINQITAVSGLELQVIPLSLDNPTNDISVGGAMTVPETLEAMNAGAAVVSDDLDILILGEMGIGNTTIAAALCTEAFDGPAQDWVGPGTGSDQAGIARKIKAVEDARTWVGVNVAADVASAFETLMMLGGRETAAIAGAILAARMKRIPIILDGYVVTASLAPLFKENHAITEHCIAGHLSAEPAHAKLLGKMKLDPLLDLGMRLGEGTGAAVAAGIVRAAVATHNKMATFEQAAVENRPDAG